LGEVGGVGHVSKFVRGLEQRNDEAIKQPEDPVETNDL
jgi:hypothetical protein